VAKDMAFDMGKCPADLPGGLLYARTHLWCRPEEDRQVLGFTAYAVRLMGDVYFLDWSVGIGASVHLFQKIGHMETSKAESDLFTPVAGVILNFNQDLLEDPSLINDDPYGAGWLLETNGNVTHLISVAEYYQHLTETWEKTQQLLKGRINL
jgi:glycine cleavage system H protein